MIRGWLDGYFAAYLLINVLFLLFIIIFRKGTWRKLRTPILIKTIVASTWTSLLC